MTAQKKLLTFDISVFFSHFLNQYENKWKEWQNSFFWRLNHFTNHITVSALFVLIDGQWLSDKKWCYEMKESSVEDAFVK